MWWPIIVSTRLPPDDTAAGVAITYGSIPFCAPLHGLADEKLDS